MGSDLDFSLSGLAAAGFKLHLEPGVDVSYRADVAVRDMPYMSQQVDNEFIYEESIMTVEFWPDGRVGQFIALTHYREEAVPTKTEEGLAMLRDALLGLTKKAPAPRPWPARI